MGKIEKFLLFFIVFFWVSRLYSETVAGNVNQKGLDDPGKGGFEEGKKIIKDHLIVETFLLKSETTTDAARKTLEEIKKEAEERCKGGAAAPAPTVAGAEPNTDAEDAKRTCLSFATHYYLSTMALSEPINGATETTYPHLAENHLIIRGGIASNWDTQVCPDAKTMQSFAMDFKSCDKPTGKINGPSAKVDSRNDLKCDFVMLCTIKASGEIVLAEDQDPAPPAVATDPNLVPATPVEALTGT